MKTEPRLPVIGYASVILCFALVLCWQHARISQSERALDALTASTTQDVFMAQMENFEKAMAVQSRIDSTYSQARGIMKAGFLLLIVLPAAVIFPMVISSSQPSSPKKRRQVLHVKDITLDDLHEDIPQGLLRAEEDPQRKLFFTNGLAFAIPTAIVILFVLLKPEAYGGIYPAGIQTILLLAVGALIVFSGTAMIYPLKKVASPGQIKTYLGVGYAILATLAWVFL